MRTALSIALTWVATAWCGFPDTIQESLTLRGHKGPIVHVAFSPDGKLLATGGADQTVRVWEVRTGKLKWTLIGHQGEVTAVTFSPDGTLLASGGWDSNLRLWDVLTGELRKSLMRDGIGPIRWIAFTPDGKTVATSNFEGAARLWDVERGTLQQSLVESSNGMWWIAFSVDGKIVWTGTVDGTVRIWIVATGKLERELVRYGKPVTLSPDGHTLASCNQQWDAISGELKNARSAPAEELQAIAFSPDSKVIATAGDAIRLYDARTWTLKATLGHEGQLSALAFSPNGKLLATGCHNGTAQLWDLAKALRREQNP